MSSQMPFEPMNVRDTRQIVTEFYSKRAIHYDKDKSNTTVGGSPIMMSVINMFELAGIRSSHLCLDVGAGTGRFTIPLQARFGARFIGLDLSLDMLKVFAKKGGEELGLVCADSAHLPFYLNSIDMVFATWSLHMFDPNTVVKEFSRVLASNGFLIIGDTVLHPLDDIDFHNRIARSVGPVPGSFYKADQIAAMLTAREYRVICQQTVPYVRLFDELLTHKSRYYSGQDESFERVLAYVPNHIREIYQIRSESITWFFSVTLAQKMD